MQNVNTEWHRNTGDIVQQEPTLINGTIEGNIQVGSPSITESEVVQVCKMANAHDFIMKLPKARIMDFTKGIRLCPPVCDGDPRRVNLAEGGGDMPIRFEHSNFSPKVTKAYLQRKSRMREEVKAGMEEVRMEPES
ncbi:hypothetical protein GCK32_018243 [Trichostrongylus colubriformis]|uniref:Uncharacterized protein n=1 Tax=Trichostrongylus colubriformis TaxID=6319 RepID=A0AAN8J1K6_TRICO